MAGVNKVILIGRVPAPYFARYCIGVSLLAHIMHYPGKQNAHNAVHLRAMRVVFGFGFGVMLAMHCRPFARYHSGIHPQPKAEEVRHYRRQSQRPVRLAPVQKDSDGSDGNVRYRKCEKHNAPPRQIPNARQ